MTSYQQPVKESHVKDGIATTKTAQNFMGPILKTEFQI
jgi:hypothetical protein